MAVSYKDLDILKGKAVYQTDNEKHVLSRETERIVRSPDYKILGFLNGFMYSFSNRCIVKSTLNNDKIANLYIQVKHAVFHEGLNYGYFYNDDVVYCVSENFEILWSIKTDDQIRSCTIDSAGCLYIVYVNSRNINKYLPDGRLLLTLVDDDVNRKCRLFKIFVTPGRGYVYVIGTSYGITDSTVYSFIDKFDIRKAIKLERYIINEANNVQLDDRFYYYDNIVVENDDVYLYGCTFIQKMNLKMIPIWKYNLSFNPITNRYNQLGHIEYDDNNYDDGIYFIEDLFETNGHGIGKLSSSGNLIWQTSFYKSLSDTKFSMCVYNEDIFTSTKMNINLVDEYILGLDNNNVLFQTKNGHLIKVVRDNSSEIYSSPYYDHFQLLAEEIKEGIPEYVNVPLLHDSGPITTENGVNLLVTIENPNYEDEENYDYYMLLCSNINDQLNKVNILATMDSMAIASNTGAVLATPDTKVDQIEPGLYDHTKFLHGDEHIFYNCLITKKKGISILTKDKGYKIIKKKKSFYKYVFRRFKDVDIVVEFFKESGIMKTLLPKYADKLIHHTTHMIEDMQEAHIPVAYDLNTTKKFEFVFDGDTYPIRELRTQIYMSNRMPYIRKNKHISIHIDSMANMVKNEEIKPFLLFIDGKAIKWSNMTIVRDWNYSFIIISNIDHSPEYKYETSAILFPCNITYSEDNKTLTNLYPNLLFDSKGLYTENVNNAEICIEVTDKDVYGDTQKYQSGKPYIEIDTLYNQISSEKNILTFEDNKFFKDSKFYLQSHGKNTYTYIRSETNNAFKVFYFIKANDSKNHLNKLPNQRQVKTDINNRIKTGKGNEYLDNFSVQFDYKYYKNKSYDTNVSKAISYIMDYDMSLLNDYYYRRSNVKSMCFTGTEILNNANLHDNFLYMPRQRKYGLDDCIVMFKNNKLYEYYKEIEYQDSSFKIPIFDHIKPNDKVEIIHYKHVDNRYYPTYVSSLSEEEEKRLANMFNIQYAKVDKARIYESDEFREYLENPDYVPNEIDYKNYLIKALRHDELLIFANSKSGEYVYEDFDIENNKQYLLEFDYKNTYENNRYKDTEIDLKDNYFRFKKVNFASRRQFQHMYYNIVGDQDTFELDPTFRFCQFKDQYMIFVNNIKLNFNDFDLMVMTNDNDLEYITIKTKSKLKSGDVIEILYVPDPYDEIILDNYTPNMGLVEIDRDILEYPFDKDLFTIFINGEKVFNNDIQNINNYKVRFKETYNYPCKITICRYIKPDRLLKEVYSYGDKWSNSVDSLNPSDFIKLFATVSK